MILVTIQEIKGLSRDRTVTALDEELAFVSVLDLNSSGNEPILDASYEIAGMLFDKLRQFRDPSVREKIIAEYSKKIDVAYGKENESGRCVAPRSRP